MELTGYASEELSGKISDLAVWKRYEFVRFQEVEDTLSEQVHDNAYVSSEIETISKVYTSVSIFVIVRFQGGEDTELYS